jgi:hypothetical protein
MEIVGTIVHELTHFLMDDHREAFLKATGGYWIDADNSDPSKGEAPVSDYGKTNASEDLAESVMFFVVQPDKLAKDCPKRFEFVKQAVAAWPKSK